MNWKVLVMIGGLCAMMGQAMAEHVSSDRISPNDWTYKALMTLEKHGAIRDMKGIALGGKSYTMYELMPLIVDVVDKRETMNESDRMLAVRLYSENRRNIMDYQIEQEDKAQKLKEARESGNAYYDKAEAEVSSGEKRMLSQAELDKKMSTFTIDTSALQATGPLMIQSYKEGKYYNDRLSGVRTTDGAGGHKKDGKLQDNSDKNKKKQQKIKDTKKKANKNTDKASKKQSYKEKSDTSGQT